MEQLLEEAGLRPNELQQCLQIFAQEGMGEESLRSSDKYSLASLGLPNGCFGKLHAYLRGKGYCVVHPGKRLCSFCIDDGDLVCKECKLSCPHEDHCLVDGLEAVEYLRDNLKRWRPTTALEQEVKKQQLLVTDLQTQLEGATTTLNALKEQLNRETRAPADIESALCNTDVSKLTELDTSCPPSTFLTDLHTLWLSLGCMDMNRHRFDTQLPLTNKHFLWLKENVFKGKKPKVLYRTNNENYSADSFHARCDNKGPTVCFFQQNKNIMGGYASQSWEKTTNYFKQAIGSFIFTLVTPQGDNPRIHTLKNRGRAMYCCNGHGPCFGADVGCYQRSGEKCISKLGDSYECRNVTQAFDVPKNNYVSLTLLEVYALTD